MRVERTGAEAAEHLASHAVAGRQHPVLTVLRLGLKLPHRRGNLDRHVRVVERRVAHHAMPQRAQTVPDGGCVVANAGDEAESGDKNFGHAHGEVHRRESCPALKRKMRRERPKAPAFCAQRRIQLELRLHGRPDYRTGFFAALRMTTGRPDWAAASTAPPQDRANAMRRRVPVLSWRDGNTRRRFIRRRP
jgi:hypothetical protein